MENFQKLDYILDTHMNATEVTQAFGFKSETMLSKMRKDKSNINTIHIDALEQYFHIPTKIFSKTVNSKEQIDKIIENYQLQKKLEKERAIKHKRILEKLEQAGLIPDNIFNNDKLEEEEIESLITKHAKNLKVNSLATPYINHSKEVFKENIKLFQKLKGVWYAYFYPSNPASAEDGVWEVKTTINQDYSVVDYWGNKGYIKLGKNESMIIKESYDHHDLTLIRFSNRQVPSEHFRFVIISNQNNTHNEMVNYGFFSRKQYATHEAKEILGKLESKQLKLDLTFNERLNERAIVPQSTKTSKLPQSK
ncbi:MAG: Unknown protein [uncultured Sulfurovum sp.]|uniref:Uncharacterized protein n=1 Tax=uncultured Sulfurovum sp. TaxID=269237 RepID=A0A6S6TDA8_9BACT|nr:MAG: Unknown protein [uncultured Sulfurovum sp.]